ncbi:ferredoxin--NADP reductase [Myxococcota bacterium]|nr:ferredoxin--NADP reductase [Myxococcota bacterium]
MIDPQEAGVSEQTWREATAPCHSLVVERIVEETHDSRSIVLAIPSELRETFRYKAGQFLSFKVPYEGQVLVRSYSLSSSPDVDSEIKVTVKRVDDGRISNLFNDRVEVGDALMVVPPAGLFVLREQTRPIVLFAGGSGVTPVISIIKSALHTTERNLSLLYANRDHRSIIFEAELQDLVSRYPGRLTVEHSLDDTHGFIDRERVERFSAGRHAADFYLCGPAVFMDLVEGALADLSIPRDRVHIERFVSPPDSPSEAPASEEGEAEAPESVTITLDGKTTEVVYTPGERVLDAAIRAGLDPPFSCQEGYCSCCMAKLLDGEVKMVLNDCLTDDLIEEGWVLTCQAVCVSGKVKIQYPD